MALSKFVCAVIILIFSLLGIIIPVLLARYGKDGITETLSWELMQCLSAGLVIGVAFMHLLPDANETLEEVTEFPYAFLFVTVGIMVMLLLDQIVAYLADDSHGSYEAPAAPDGEAPAASDGEDKQLKLQRSVSFVKATNLKKASSSAIQGHAHGHAHGHGHRGGGKPNDKRERAKAVVIELSIATHSVLIGMGLGTAPVDEQGVLLAALSFHQFFEGLALGGSVTNQMENTCFVCNLVASFTLSCPIGVLIGVAITDSLEGANSAWIMGSLNAVACGTLTYVGLIELLSSSFHKPNLGARVFPMVFAVACGIAVMAVMAIWA